MQPKPYTKAVIFDFDHTLADAHGGAEMDKHIDKARQWTRKYWLKLKDLTKHKPVLGVRNVVEMYFRKGEEPTAKEGAIALLKALKAEGIPVFVKSVGHPDRLKAQVDRLFGDLIPQEHVYAGRDGAPAKPERDAYTYILNKHGITYDDPQQIVMVGDIVLLDLAPAIDHGMSALWINEDGQSQPDSERFKAEGKIHEFRSMREIHQFITDREAEKAVPRVDPVTSAEIELIEAQRAAHYRRQLPHEQAQRNAPRGGLGL